MITSLLTSPSLTSTPIQFSQSHSATVPHSAFCFPFSLLSFQNTSTNKLPTHKPLSKHMKPISSRRVLHQPLVPIQWGTPPPPLFFPNPISTTTAAAAAYSPPWTHHHDSTTKIVIIVASISIGTFFFLSILFMFFHQKGIQNHHRHDNVPVKRGAGGREIAPAAAAGAGAGDEGSEAGSSTAGMNETVQMELLIHHPISPEIKPLPPLLPGAAQRSVSRPSPEISPLTPPLTRQDRQHVQFFMGKATLERSYSWSGTTRFSIGSSPNLQPQSPPPADLNDNFEVDFAGKGNSIINSSENVNVWGRFKSRSLRLDGDMIEIATASFGKERVPQRQQKNGVLDAEKAESIEILLRTSTVKTEDLCEALLDGGSEFLGTEFLDSLIKLAPTKEEEFMLRHFRGEVTRLNAAERFLKAVLDVPFAMKRIEVMLYQARFETNIDYLKSSFQTLQDACQDLRRNKLFLKLLEAANSTRNQFDTETQEYPKSSGLDSLLQLCDAKEEGRKPTPLHYAVEDLISNQKLHSDIIREEECKRQGLKVMAGLSAEFENVKKAAEMDLQMLMDHVKKQDLGLEKVKWLLQLDKACNVGESFFKKMKKFVIEAEIEIEDVKEQAEVTSRCIRETTEHFNLAKDAGHPLRLLTLVRDFLLVLDGVCKDIRRMHDKAMFGSLSGRILNFSPVPSAVT